MDIIYGRENSKYSLNVIPEIDDTIVNYSTNWEFEDTLLDGTDNTRYFQDLDYTEEPTIIYESSGIKSIKVETDFDDGWGNIYIHETFLDVEVQTYEKPILDFNWSPEEPTIIDTVTFNQFHDDRRDDSLSKIHGRIDNVNVDLFNDKNIDINNISKSDIFQYKFSEKSDNIAINLEVTYWDGFEYQNHNLIKYLDMSNIPPVSNWDRVDSGLCVPSFEWFATSFDLDDDIDTLKYYWELSQEIGNVWNLVDTGNSKNYSYPFQFEGTYKIRLKTEDLEGLFNIKEEIFNVLFKECNGTSGTALSGTIRLQFGGFQLIAIPVNRKVSDLVDLVASKTGLSDFEVIEVCNAAPGNASSVGSMFNYVPGVTNKLSSNNFELIMEDGNIKEITGFWVHMKEHPTLSYIDIQWDSNTGELK